MLCRHTAHYGTCRYILVYHCTCGYEGIIPDSHTCQNSSVRTNPHPFAYPDRRMVQVLPVFGSQTVV